MKDKKTGTEWFKTALSKLNTFVAEGLSDYDPDQDYDTRVKLPKWQLSALKKRKREQKR